MQAQSRYRHNFSVSQVFACIGYLLYLLFVQRSAPASHHYHTRIQRHLLLDYGAQSRAEIVDSKTASLVGAVDEVGGA